MIRRNFEEKEIKISFSNRVTAKVSKSYSEPSLININLINAIKSKSLDLNDIWFPLLNFRFLSYTKYIHVFGVY